VSARSDEFARRRVALQSQCALQRAQFAQSAAELGAGLHFMDRGLSIIRGTRILPIVMAAVSAMGFATRSGAVIRLLSRGWLIVSTLRQLKRALR
jgi:hypothetical protein